MTNLAIKIEAVSKRYRLGETHENTLSDRFARALGSLRGRAPPTPGEYFWALRDASLEVREGEALGIIGGNGAGKSTLLKILSRITSPTTGRAVLRGRLSSLLEVGTGFHPELTGRENVFLNGAILGMRRAEVQRKFDEIVAFSGVERFIDTPVKRFSSGMYVRLAFAVAAHLEPDILIIDEVLAVGDAEFQKRCLGKMNDVSRQGRTVVFVSHDMMAVQRLCTQVAWLSAGRVAAYGEPGKVISTYLEASQAPDDLSGADGFLFKATATDLEAKAELIGLELLGPDGVVVRSVKTWQEVTFRITFDVAESQRNFAAVISISTIEGAVLILTSTTPDHSVFIGLEAGRFVITCQFDSLPLSAGDYVIGIGLAIPHQEYLWRNDAVARLRVEPADVYDSGLPPSSDRYLFATRHHWSNASTVNPQGSGA
jgi:lipopolysaccharide transport system ATP-binding protein